MKRKKYNRIYSKYFYFIIWKCTLFSYDM